MSSVQSTILQCSKHGRYLMSLTGGAFRRAQELHGGCCGSFQSRDRSASHRRSPGQLLTHTSLAQPTAFGEDSLPHSDDIQLSHSFLDPRREAVCVVLGLGVWMSKRRFFPIAQWL